MGSFIIYSYIKQTCSVIFHRNCGTRLRKTVPRQVWTLLSLLLKYTHFCVMFKHTQAHTRTHTHTHSLTRIRTQPHTHTEWWTCGRGKSNLLLSHALTRTHTRSLSLSLTHTHRHKRWWRNKKKAAGCK